MKRALSCLLLALASTAALQAGGRGTVTCKYEDFKAEAAVTQEEQAQGLMWRRELAKDRCMIFIYGGDGMLPIWMRNCFIHLDVAWFDASGRIVEIAKDVPPCSPEKSKIPDCPTYGGQEMSRGFVEFPAGTFKRLKLKVGDTLGWDLKLDGGQVVRGGQRGMMIAH